MKRSEINAILHDTVSFCREQKFLLPPFAFWSVEEWKRRGDQAREIRACQMGWDITDFGSGDFDSCGLTLFTIRNGDGSEKYPKPYCEKLLVSQEEQVTPMHFHWSKMEDIINRGGGTLNVKLYGSDENEALSGRPVTVSCDGVPRTVEAGGCVKVPPGESITLFRGLYHEFSVEKGTGPALLGEVSTVNDDTVDNRFHREVGRFPEVVEDEPPLYLLTCDYDKFLS
jgi:hypothetical protein